MKNTAGAFRIFENCFWSWSKCIRNHYWGLQKCSLQFCNRYAFVCVPNSSIFLTDLDFPKFFTVHVRNAVFPMRADTLYGLPFLLSVVRTSKYGSPGLLSPIVLISVESLVLKRPETFNTSEIKNESGKRFIFWVWNYW